MSKNGKLDEYDHSDSNLIENSVNRCDIKFI